MKKSLLFLCAFLAVSMMANAQPASPMVNGRGTTDMWDFVKSFSCSTGRQHGVVYDGEYLYTSAWGKSSTVLSMFYKYDLEGHLIEEFDVPGVTNSDYFLRDMTFDGTYVYGCDAHSGKIWCYDLPNKTLVGQINTNFNELGTCTYDPVYDAFWVGQRATGNSPELHLDLKLIDREGHVIKTATPHFLGGHTVHGTGYFTDEDGIAHLFLFAVEGFTAQVFDYDIEADRMDPNYIFAFAVTPGWGAACSAGGAFIGECEGSVFFFGDVDKSPNLIGIYALGDSPLPPEPPTPTEDLCYDFNDGILLWTSIDADGDGYHWEMRPNWGNQENPWSVTSASNYAGNPLTPDNYLISPLKGPYHKVYFRASAQDAAYPAEHFAIAVSTEGNTSPADFTVVWEQTLTAKDPGAWYNFSVDLSQFNGENIWVAFRHFNCTNQFFLNLDDVALLIQPEDVAEAKDVLVTVYPNPATDRFVVSVERPVHHYEVYDMTGALVRRAVVNAEGFEVNLSDLSSGAYLLRLHCDEAVVMRRFVKE